MIHSMTAYGRVENSEGQNSISCEIRSVNHRYSEISIRLPEELRPLEQKIRDHISGKIKRGKIECNIRIEKHNAYNEALSINQDLLKNIIEAAKRINSDLSTSAPLDSLDLLRWPGVLEKSTLDVEEIGKLLFPLLNEATRNPPPPRLPLLGEVTAKANPTATAASIAFPPFFNISMPAWDAC